MYAIFCTDLVPFYLFSVCYRDLSVAFYFQGLWADAQQTLAILNLVIQKLVLLTQNNAIQNV